MRFLGRSDNHDQPALSLAGMEPEADEVYTFVPTAFTNAGSDGEGLTAP